MSRNFYAVFWSRPPFSDLQLKNEKRDVLEEARDTIENLSKKFSELSSAVGDAYTAPALHMQRQAYFLGATYAAPRKIKFPTELQKNRFFNFNLEIK